MPEPVELEQMLAAREARAARQAALLVQYGKPLISYTMNIAGPLKNGPDIRRGFALGQTLLLGELARSGAPVLYAETETAAPTGCEGRYVVDWPAPALKEITTAIEDGTAIGRLLDLDVLDAAGAKLERPAPRRCLLCGRPARDCARSRTHTVAELQAKTGVLLACALAEQDTHTATAAAVRALLYEVCVTPKPGLVDRANNGSHRDMDIYTFMDSAAGLWPYFAHCVQVGRQTAAQPAPQSLARLRWPGRLAEGAMLRATGGVNTHKGALYTLGLVCCALGRLPRDAWARPAQVLAEVAAMTVGTVQRELAPLTSGTAATAATAGQRFYLQYGVTGVRGQAQAGFPAVLAHGLPALESALAAGRTNDEAGAAALLALLACTEDTNMIARGGIDAARAAAAEARDLLARTPCPDAAALAALDRRYTAANLSPGGSADLLALCWLLHFVKEAT